MLRIKKIDHVAICVRDVDDAGEPWRALFGIDHGEREWVESQKVETLLLPIGESSLELVAPRGNAGLERFLDKRGPGLHHIALQVDRIDDAIAFLTALGVPLIDTVSRPGARGSKVAFLHPKATGGVLVELVEAPSRRDSDP
jgi:methylmalonyl-CoA/ethylmalonyl-CoA epimerase